MPSGYRAKQVWHANLSGQAAPDLVVASVGPPVTSLGFHSADLRVLSWDPLAHHWTVSFDAQKVTTPDNFTEPGTSNSYPGYYVGPDSPPYMKPVPLLDPKADVNLGEVRFDKLLRGSRQQLLFSAVMNYGGSGAPMILAVVDLKGGIAQLLYSWSGEGLYRWNVRNRTLHAVAAYWTPADAHCCFLRTYRFSAASKNGFMTEVSDDRPWLGVTVHDLGGPGAFNGPQQITELADGSPATGLLQVGDILLEVENAPPPPKNGDPNAVNTIFDKLNLLHAGDRARLLVARGNARLTVTVKLASMKDSTMQPLHSFEESAL